MYQHRMPSISKNQALIILYFLLICSACQDNGGKNANKNFISNLFTADVVDVKNVSNSITIFLGNNPIAFVFENDSIKNSADLLKLYQINKNEALWLSGAGANKNAEEFLKQVALLEEDGINLQEFHLDKLKEWQSKIKAGHADDSIAWMYDLGMSIACLKACDVMMHGQFDKNNYTQDWFNKNDTAFNAANYLSNAIAKDSMAYLFGGLRPSMPEYSIFKTKLKELQAIEKNGGWGTVEGLKDSLENGLDNKSIASLRKRLFKEIGIPKDTTSTIMQDDLQTAINSFQYLHDLKLTGKLDTSTVKRLNTSVSTKIKHLKSNLERLRWIQKDLHQPYVWVNIPKMDLQYIDKDSSQFKMRVVVGRTSRPTPTLNAIMSNVVINPGWSVPPTIMREEVVPGIGRRGGSYLSRRGLKAYYRGHEVNASRINAKNFKQFSIQQKPGLNSALGAVKFNMPNPHAIYLHDTPHREDFVKYYRAYSSGCIRVAKPREFAEFVLADTNFSKPKIDTMVQKRITKEVPLKKNIEVHIVYLTNGLDSLGNVMYLRDIYGKDKAMEGIWK